MAYSSRPVEWLMNKQAALPAVIPAAIAAAPAVAGWGSRLWTGAKWAAGLGAAALGGFGYLNKKMQDDEDERLDDSKIDQMMPKDYVMPNNDLSFSKSLKGRE
jgi:hypothetical protein